MVQGLAELKNVDQSDGDISASNALFSHATDSDDWSISSEKKIDDDSTSKLDTSTAKNTLDSDFYFEVGTRPAVRSRL